MVINFLTILASQLADIKRCKVVIAPPVIYLDAAGCCLKNSYIKLCAQNVDVSVSGAYTGDISAVMLKDLNAQYVIIGHSERRIHHKESNVYIAKKFSIAHKVGLIPILCVGENKEEHDAGYAHLVCVEQIDEIIKLLGIQVFKDIIIAYEPVWAIGSGVNAVPENVQNIHKAIRDHISKYDRYIARQVLIQYGGSVTPVNVEQFLNKRDIDGVLVGAASLNTDSFVKIVKIAENCRKLCFF